MFCSAHISEILIYIFNMLCECQAASVVKSRSVDLLIETTCILTHDGLIFYHCIQMPRVVQYIILILSNALKNSTHTHTCTGHMKDNHTLVGLYHLFHLVQKNNRIKPCWIMIQASFRRVFNSQSAALILYTSQQWKWRKGFNSSLNIIWSSVSTPRTLWHGKEEAEIKPPTPWSVDYLLYLLSHRCPILSICPSLSANYFNCLSITSS